MLWLGIYFHVFFGLIFLILFPPFMMVLDFRHLFKANSPAY